MKSEPLAPGAPAIILYRQVDRDDNGRTSHEDNYVRIKILTEEGRKYADIEIPFYKEWENVVGIRARTIKPDGSVVDFNGRVFDKYIVKARGLKYLAKTFTIPDVQVGSIIECSYTTDLNYIYDSHWILSSELFTKSARFSLKPYHANYVNLNLRWTFQYLPKGTPEPSSDGGIVRLVAKNIPAFHAEDFMPPENELKARVDFLYTAEAFEPDPDKFWKRLGKERNDQLEAYLGKPKAMEKAVVDIVSPSDTPEVKLQKIYARVQQLRNTSFEQQKTEQEEKRNKDKPANKVEDIWKRGYGNGTELTWLYLALVRAAGLDAHGVLVADRALYFFDRKLMNDSKLDSSVVEVRVNGKELYCDPGFAFAPFGLLPWPETGVDGLRLDKDGGSWIRTDQPPSSASRVERKAELNLSDSGDLEGKLTVTFTGLEAMRRRVEERNVDETGRRKFLEEEVKDSVPSPSEVDLINHPDWRSSAPSLVAEFNLKVTGWASAAGHRTLLPVGLFSATEKHTFEHSDRVHPIYFQYPHLVTDDIAIQLPSGWQVTGLPKAKDLEVSRLMLYTVKAENSENKVLVSRTLGVDANFLGPGFYPALREFFQKLRASDEEQVVLQPGKAEISN